MKKLKVRLRACWLILTRNYDHWFIVNLSKEDLIKLLNNQDFEVDAFLHGIQPYIFNTVIKTIADSKTDADMTLDRMLFEAKAEEKYKKK